MGSRLRPFAPAKLGKTVSWNHLAFPRRSGSQSLALVNGILHSATYSRMLTSLPGTFVMEAAKSRLTEARRGRQHVFNKVVSSNLLLVYLIALSVLVSTVISATILHAFLTLGFPNSF